MKDATLNWVRLPLEHASNTRELGGYPTKDGGQTKWHAFVRADDLSKLEEEEITFLLDYGVNTIIDLRAEEEIKESPNPFSVIEQAEYHHVSFAESEVGGHKIADLTTVDVSKININPSDFYISLLSAKEKVVQLFQIISNAKEGCILFHCRAGKDRTGVLSMLLLACAGVAKQDIITNYEVSFTNNKVIWENLFTEEIKLPELFYSRSEFIGETYDHIIRTYGSFEQYFQQAGISKTEIEKVKKRIL